MHEQARQRRRNGSCPVRFEFTTICIIIGISSSISNATTANHRLTISRLLQVQELNTPPQSRALPSSSCSLLYGLQSFPSSASPQKTTLERALRSPAAQTTLLSSEQQPAHAPPPRAVALCLKEPPDPSPASRFSEPRLRARWPTATTACGAPPRAAAASVSVSPCFQCKILLIIIKMLRRLPRRSRRTMKVFEQVNAINIRRLGNSLELVCVCMFVLFAKLLCNVRIASATRASRLHVVPPPRATCTASARIAPQCSPLPTHPRVPVTEP
jgi:hypothetical protein